MIEIDGSHGEGGGQVLRTALSLSCLLHVPVRIFNIRAGREQGGLARQHMAVVNALARICNAKVAGAALGSQELSFEPGRIASGKYEFDIGSAGSVVLLAQALLPVLCAASGKSEVVLRGGTHVRGSPSFEYFKRVFLPAAQKFGVKAEVKMNMAGFYPAGGGEVLLLVEGGELAAADIVKQEKGEAWCSIAYGKLPAAVAQRERKVVKGILAGERLAFDIYEERNAASAGNAVTVGCGFVGAAAVGERGKPAEEVAREAAEKFLEERESGCGVDSHLADQLLLYMALAKGDCRISAPCISRHAKTNMEIIGKFGSAKFSETAAGGGIEIAKTGRVG